MQCTNIKICFHGINRLLFVGNLNDEKFLSHVVNVILPPYENINVMFFIQPCNKPYACTVYHMSALLIDYVLFDFLYVSFSLIINVLKLLKLI